MKALGNIETALSATEPQATQWLAEKKAEAIEAFGERFRCVYFEDKKHGNHVYIGPAIKELADKHSSELRLTASKRKEQV
jgi:hypothetical protein